MDLDKALKNAIPGGNLTKPILIALGTLLVGKMLGGGSKAAPEPEVLPPTTPGRAPANAGIDDGGVLGGLGGLLDKLRTGGAAEQVDSWVGTGQNKPLPPKQLGNAIGQTTISELAKKAGISEQELLDQLSQVLPQVVDKWTPQGRLPSRTEFGGIFGGR
ncbi:MAG: YidB family protein [Beijerinckiaceae bacterium]